MMYNAQMHHLWLHQDEQLTGITMSMNCYDDIHMDSGLFKDKEGHYFSFVHCLKDLLNIIGSENFEYDFIQNNYPYSEFIHRTGNMITKEGPFKGLYLDYIKSSSQVKSVMKRAFGTQFYKSAKKMDSDDFIKKYKPTIIFNDPSAKKYKSVYNTLLLMADRAIYYLGNNSLNFVKYVGLDKGEEVVFIIRRNLHQYPYFTIQLFTEDPDPVFDNESVSNKVKEKSYIIKKSIRKSDANQIERTGFQSSSGYIEMGVTSSFEEAKKIYNNLIAETIDEYISEDYIKTEYESEDKTHYLVSLTNKNINESVYIDFDIEEK